ncbi:MAG: Unknown protein [uncultured Sulfurovum sp.]|uniref:Uncharacterized protein n=1 Tax=uncultured Sulfurovum sp. TaxID=269237 RepID=A0A6S6SKT6_9BACT|nr:MAG: Unknown protein [uncultured Sulfurovum sp.]
MQINDQFNPNLAYMLQPSKENAFTILGKGVSDYMSMRDNQELKEINLESIREKMNSSKKADTRADKKLDLDTEIGEANIDNLNFNQGMKNKEFGLNEKSTNANIDNLNFNQGMKNKEFGLSEKRTNANIDNLNFNQGMKNKEFGLSEKRTNANINYNNKSLGIQQQKVDIARSKKKSKKTIIAPVSDLRELNKNISKRNKPKEQEKTIVRTGMKDGKKVIQYSDGSIEYGN